MLVVGTVSRWPVSRLIVLAGEEVAQKVEVIVGHRHLFSQHAHPLFIESFNHSNDHFELNISADKLTILAQTSALYDRLFGLLRKSQFDFAIFCLRCAPKVNGN